MRHIQASIHFAENDGRVTCKESVHVGAIDAFPDDATLCRSQLRWRPSEFMAGLPLADKTASVLDRLWLAAGRSGTVPV